MGVAGSGKSVQGRLLADQLALPWLSTGEFLRMLISGKRRKDMMAGKLLEDQEIIGLVRKIFTIIDTDHEFVLDGFPRTTAQADWLLNEAKHGQLSITAVVHIKASLPVVEQRLLGRGRPDDHAAAIKERFNEYEEAIIPLLGHFKQSGVPICEIDGEQSPEKVHQDIVAALKKAGHVYSSQV
jgi:adenylate kinase